MCRPPQKRHLYATYLVKNLLVAEIAAERASALVA